MHQKQYQNLCTSERSSESFLIMKVIKYRIFIWSEFKAFILSQRDERKIDMTDSCGDSCGCILIQFGRKKTKRKVTDCSFACIGLDEHFRHRLTPDDESFEKVESFINRCIHKKVKTYAQAKDILQKFEENA